MATTEDWNPRSLSSFSTFGGAQGSPPLTGMNGHVNGALHVNGTNGLGGGGGGGGGGVSVKVSGAKTNGSTAIVTVNGSTPPDILDSPDVIAHCRKPVAPSPGQSPDQNHVNKPNVPQNKPNVPQNKPTVAQREGKVAQMVQREVKTAQISQNKTTLAQHKAGKGPHKTNITTGSPEPGRQTPKPLGMPVAPPSVEGIIRPRHYHSKSLVGDEAPAEAPMAPKHGHSRSLVDAGDLVPPKSPDGAPLNEVHLFLGPADRRFGFSVVGGMDEGFPPRIDEIAKGSPADKADLEVGDEILEVNGKSLEDATHTEVISHIHQCIRSRTICLRVKRRTGNKLAVDLAASSNVQDAFVIAVEQQARERLERLSALKKIKPVDMTKLSSQVNLAQLEPHKSVVSVGGSGGQAGQGGRSPALSASAEQRDDVNGVLESSPIYVTSVPNLTSEQQRPLSRSRSSTPNRASPSPRRTHSARGPRDTPPSPLTPSPRREAPTLKAAESPSGERSSRRSSRRRGSARLANGHHGAEAEAEANKSGDELELTHDLNDTLDDTEELDPDEPLDAQGDRTESDDKVDSEGACLSESGDSLPGTPEKAYGITASDSRRSSSRGSRRGHASPREAQLDKEPLPPPPPPLDARPKTPVHAVSSVESRESTSSRKSGGSSGSGEVGRGTPRHKGAGGSTPRHSRKGREHREQQQQQQPTVISAPEIGYDNMISMVEFDPGHREMAVDVPDSFVGRTKTPPRYPPPKPQGQTITPIHNNNNNSSKGSRKGGSSGTATPQNGTLPKPTPPPRIPDQPQLPPQLPPGQQETLIQQPSTEAEMNRIRKYEEELKLRREREEQEAMLRTSLRSSQKLQQLANKPVASGVVNEAFAVEEAQQATASAVAEAATAEEMPSGAESKQSPETPSKVIGINELIQSLQRIQTVLKSNGHRISEDMTLVAQLLTNPEFQKVLAVHNKVQETWCLNRPPTPVTDNAQELVAECLQELQEFSVPEAAELIDILNKYSMEGLLHVHDSIAEREPLPVGNLPEEEVLDRVTNYPEESVKIVRIDKTNEPLGATIRNEGDSVIIGRIVKGGAAEKSRLLHEGDEILEVNGMEVRGKSVNDICDMLAGMTGTLTFIIIPSGQQTTTPARPPLSQTIHVKAHFDYDPEEDMYIPCRELGMSFQKGDILHVISQTDPNWWQAYRDGEEDQTLAGLIPSKSFQQHREAMRQTVVGDNNNKEKTKKGKLLCAKKHQKKKKKKMLYPNYNEARSNSPLPITGLGNPCADMSEASRAGGSPVRNRVLTVRFALPTCRCMKGSSRRRRCSSMSDLDVDFDSEEILTYEDVALYYPRANRKRPIVLIGPPNIGRHELRQKLMEDRERFAAAIPHTSRTRRETECDGQDYHFISRTQFESDILARKFVEHGEYEKAYYGTSIAAIRAVVNSGKICVLNLHPLSLKILKGSDLKPFVVFVAPPSLEKLRQKKQRLGEPVKDEELKETIEKAREMEEQYGHYFDLIIINQDVDRAYHQLLHEINMLEREPQWVPAAWLAHDQQ
ncbi:uncharacterized protein LOC126995166 isoform X3 [Eriocheir sinensis]|uniref:uncharacterized protein LOC126995166 isoform X3 n=1 Tax=Eriocheir sinensis TaxID=95602 RepID=UPI0021C6535C|nr:uncharacterized protein LOC126995166 isoform X3 [Eriocheir sinensis]